MRPLTPVDRAVSTYCAEWPREKIGQPSIAIVNPESLEEATPPDFEFLYIDIGSVTEGRVDWEKVSHLKFADAPSRARRVVRFGDTLICTVRPLLKSHTYVNWQENQRVVPVVCSTGFAVVRCAAKLLPSFFRHLPFSEQVIRQLVAWQCGTNYPAVNESDVQKLTIPVPSRMSRRRLHASLMRLIWRRKRRVLLSSGRRTSSERSCSNYFPPEFAMSHRSRRSLG